MALLINTNDSAITADVSGFRNFLSSLHSVLGKKDIITAFRIFPLMTEDTSLYCGNVPVCVIAFSSDARHRNPSEINLVMTLSFLFDTSSMHKAHFTLRRY